MSKHIAGCRFLLGAASMTSWLALAHAAPAGAQEATDMRRYGAVSTAGAGEPGIEAHGGEAPIEVDFLTVSTSGDGADGVVVDSLGPVLVSGSQVTTSGNDAIGVAVTSRDGPVQLFVDKVTTSGANSDAIRATAGMGGLSVRVAAIATAGGTGLDLTSAGPIAVAVGAVATGAAGGPAVRIAGGAAPIDLGFVTVATQGDDATGVAITGSGTVGVSGSSVITTGAGATAIDVATDDAVQVQVDRVAARGADAIRVAGGTGPVAVRVGSATAGDGSAIDVSAMGAIGVSAGSVAATGGAGVRLAGGAAPIDLGFVTVATQGDDATGVAITGSGTVGVSGSSVITTGAGATAIDVATDDAVQVQVDRVAARGADAIRVAGGTGPVVVRVGSATAGDGSAIDVSAMGAIGVSAGSVAATGGAGVRLAGGAAPIDLGFVTVATQGDDATGVAITGSGTVGVSGSSVITTGAGATAIDVATDDAVQVQVDRVVASGADAIRVAGGTGPVAVRVGSATAGDGSAIDVSAMGAIGVSAGSVAATGGAGVRLAGGAAPIDLGFVTVATQGDDATGVAITGSGMVGVSGSSVITTGAGATAIDVATDDAVQVQVDKVAASGADAIRVAGGTGPVAVRVGSATAGDGSAIDVSAMGAIGVSAGSVAATGGAGVRLAGGAAPIDLGFVTVATQGDDATGVAITGSGTVGVSGSSVITTGAGATAIDVATDDAVQVQVDKVAASGVGADALWLDSGAGDADVRVGSATSAGGTAIDVMGNGRIHVAAGSASTGANGGPAVRLAGGAGPVDVKFVTVATQADGATGVVASGGGAIGIVGSRVTTTGAGATGVAVTDKTGPIYLQIDSVTATGAGADAIQVNGGSGTTAVRVASVTAASGTAIDLATTGAIDVRASNIVSSGAGAAIHATTTGTLSVRTGTLASGIDTAIDIAAGQGSTVSIGGRLASQSGLVLRVGGNGSTVTVEPGGVLSGRFQLSDGADTLTNQGVFQIAPGSSFGAGNDRLVNTGVVRLPASLMPVSATLSGLEVTTNAGLIDLANGVVGDTLRLPGDYIGEGNATLRIDRAASGAHDMLIIEGRATGSTLLDIVGFTGGDSRIYDGASIVQAGSGSDPDAFRLPVSSSQGMLVDTVVELNPTTSTYALFSTPARGPVDLSQLPFSARQSFHRAATDIAANWQDQGGANGAARTGLWGQFAGSNDKFDRSVSATLTGAVRSTGFRLNEHVLSGQLGYTIGLGGLGAIGVVAGYSHVDGHPSGDAGRYTIESIDVGVSGHLGAGPAYADVLALYDRHRIDFTSGQIDLRPHGNSYGGLAELGARIPLGLARLTLFGSLEYSRTDLGSYPIQDARLSFDSGDSLRGSAGLRGDATLAGVRIFAEARAVREFDGDDRLRLTIAGAQGLIESGGVRTYGAGVLGAELLPVGSRASVSVSAKGALGDNYRSIGGRAAFRLSF